MASGRVKRKRTVSVVAALPGKSRPASRPRGTVTTTVARLARRPSTQARLKTLTASIRGAVSARPESARSPSQPPLAVQEEWAEADHVKVATPPLETTAGSAVSVTVGRPPSVSRPEHDTRPAGALIITVTSRLAIRERVPRRDIGPILVNQRGRFVHALPLRQLPRCASPGCFNAPRPIGTRRRRSGGQTDDSGRHSIEPAPGRAFPGRARG